MNWTVCRFAVSLCTAGQLWAVHCVWLQWGYVLLADCELNCASGCSEIVYCWRILNWTMCLFVVRLCTAGGLWTELCFYLRWGYVLLGGCELYSVSGCSEVMYCWRIVNWTVCFFAVRLCTAGGLWSEMSVFLRWGYVLLADCELNCVSVCVEVMYCWRIVNWTMCLFAVRLCTAGGLWTEQFVCLLWGQVILADCELNCVFVCGEVIYCCRIVKWTPLWHILPIPRGKLIYIRGYNGKNIIKLLINIITGLSFALSSLSLR